MKDYLLKNHDEILALFADHIRLVLLTLLFSLIIAAPLSVAIFRRKNLSAIITRVFGAIYSIPSLALFALLIPLLGIGNLNAIFVLVLYNQFLLLRNFTIGLRASPPKLIEAARGLGMTHPMILLRVRLPIAAPMIISGIQLSLISTIGIATIATVIGAHGLGDILFQGLRSHNANKLIVGMVLAAGLAIATNIIFSLILRRYKHDI
jgi:osmoprotectant transport system permease protein